MSIERLRKTGWFDVTSNGHRVLINLKNISYIKETNSGFVEFYDSNDVPLISDVHFDTVEKYISEYT